MLKHGKDSRHLLLQVALHLAPCVTLPKKCARRSLPWTTESKVSRESSRRSVAESIGISEVSELGTDSRHRSLKIAVARIDAISTSRCSSGRRVESAQLVNIKNLRKRNATDASMARAGLWPSMACIVYLPGGDSSWRRKQKGRFYARTNAEFSNKVFENSLQDGRTIDIHPRSKTVLQNTCSLKNNSLPAFRNTKSTTVRTT